VASGESPSSFSDLPRPVQVQIAGLGPLLFGAVCGFVLSESATGWWALQVVAALGGLAGGLDHDGPRPGALRGLVAGALFGAGIVIAQAVSVHQPLAEVPSPIGILVVITTVLGTGLGAVGGVAGRRTRRANARVRQPK
jgi:hypothetical protein